MLEFPYDKGFLFHCRLRFYIICLTFSVTKLILYLVCRRYNTPTLKALTQDHKNDVFSNSVALACGYIGTGIIQERSYAGSDKFNNNSA